METKLLDDWGETNAELAARYRDAFDEISHWVTDQVAVGNTWIFSEVPGELVRIQHRRGPNRRSQCLS